MLLERFSQLLQRYRWDCDRQECCLVLSKANVFIEEYYAPGFLKLRRILGKRTNNSLTEGPLYESIMEQQSNRRGEPRQFNLY